MSMSDQLTENEIHYSENRNFAYIKPEALGRLPNAELTMRKVVYDALASGKAGFAGSHPARPPLFNVGKNTLYDSPIIGGRDAIILSCEMDLRDVHDPRFYPHKAIFEHRKNRDLVRVVPGASSYRVPYDVYYERIQIVDKETGKTSWESKKLAQPKRQIAIYFNGSDIEGISPLEEWTPQSKEDQVEHFRTLIQDTGITIKENPGATIPDLSSFDDVIKVPQINRETADDEIDYQSMVLQLSINYRILRQSMETIGSNTIHQMRANMARYALTQERGLDYRAHVSPAALEKWREHIGTKDKNLEMSLLSVQKFLRRYNDHEWSQSVYQQVQTKQQKEIDPVIERQMTLAQTNYQNNSVATNYYLQRKFPKNSLDAHLQEDIRKQPVSNPFRLIAINEIIEETPINAPSPGAYYQAKTVSQLPDILSRTDAIRMQYTWMERKEGIIHKAAIDQERTER